MTHLRTSALAILGCVGLTGCLSSDLRILVRPDGSGTITSSLRITRSGLDVFNALASAQQPLPRDNSAISRLPDPARLAWLLGPNLRLLTSSADRWAEGEGRTAVYAFEAIDGLAIDAAFPVTEGTSIASDALGMDIHERMDTRVSFALRRGADGTVILTASFADQRLDPSAAPARTDPKPPNTPEELAALRALVKGARMRLAIETETPLIRTSSPYAEQNRVILFDLDVARIALGDEVDRLWGFQPASLDEIRWAVHDLPGARLALDREVTIEFQGAQTPPAASAQAPPDTDIYLASLSRSANGEMTVGTPSNMTKSPGYDNQPSFDPSGAAIYFTSMRGPSSRATDIFRYDIASRATTQVTSTPESEYSPTVMPDGGHLSVVRVEADGTQRLWRFGLDGKDPRLLLAEVKPVGYHAWAGPQTVALFVLGAPPALQLADTSTGQAETIARDVGRSLQRIPAGGVSFVQRRTDATGTSALTVMRLDSGTRSVAPIADLMPGVTEPYVAWTPDGTLLVAHDDSLFYWRADTREWKLISDLRRLGLRGVSRLAVSPRGDRLAIVAASQ